MYIRIYKACHTLRWISKSHFFTRMYYACTHIPLTIHRTRAPAQGPNWARPRARCPPCGQHKHKVKVDVDVNCNEFSKSPAAFATFPTFDRCQVRGGGSSFGRVWYCSCRIVCRIVVVSFLSCRVLCCSRCVLCVCDLFLFLWHVQHSLFLTTALFLTCNG